MLNPIRMLSISVVFSLLTGCALPPERVALTTQSIKHIKQLDESLIVKQKKITPTYEEGAVLVPAFDPASLLASAITNSIFAAIAMHENSVNDKLIAPLIKQTQDHEFAKDFQKAMLTQLEQKKSLGHLKNSFQLKDMTFSSESNFNESMRKSKQGKAYFNIPLHYQLSPKMDSFWVQADAELLLKEDHDLKTLYKNKFTYYMPLPKKSKNKQDNIKIWTANNGQLIHQAFKNAALELARVIVDDLKPIDNKTLLSGNVHKVDTEMGKKGKVSILSNTKGKLTIRNSDGTILITSGHVLS